MSSEKRNSGGLLDSPELVVAVGLPGPQREVDAVEFHLRQLVDEAVVFRQPPRLRAHGKTVHEPPAAGGQIRRQHQVEIGKIKPPGVFGQDVTVQEVAHAVTLHQVVDAPEDGRGAPAGDDKSRTSAALDLAQQDRLFRQWRRRCAEQVPQSRVRRRSSDHEGRAGATRRSRRYRGRDPKNCPQVSLQFLGGEPLQLGRLLSDRYDDNRTRIETSGLGGGKAAHRSEDNQTSVYHRAVNRRSRKKAPSRGAV